MYSSEMLSNRIIHVSKKRRRTFPGAVSFKPLIQFYFSKELVFFCCTVIEIYQSLQVFVSFHSLSLILREESLCFFRICSHQGIVTNFSVQEFLIISLRLFAVQSKFLLSFRIESEVVPVSAFYCKLFLCLCFAHTFLDSMVDTWSVSDDQGWSRMSG